MVQVLSVSRRGSHEAGPATELAAHGLRATRQRLAVLEVLRRSRSHPTASDVFRQLRREQPSISLKTVYDALDVLVNAGLAACVTDAGAPYRYEANAAPHYHAHCRVCGSLADLPAKADGHIRGRTPLPEGFEVDEIRVTLLGRFPRCREGF